MTTKVSKNVYDKVSDWDDGKGGARDDRQDAAKQKKSQSKDKLNKQAGSHAASTPKVAHSALWADSKNDNEADRRSSKSMKTQKPTVKDTNAEVVKGDWDKDTGSKKGKELIGRDFPDMV